MNILCKTETLKVLYLLTDSLSKPSRAIYYTVNFKMLTEVEKFHIKEVLVLLSEPDLHSIVSTVTNNMIHMTNSEDAITVILNHSDSVKSILHRKKVTKEILIRYLISKQIPFILSEEKSSLISKLLQLWNCNQLMTTSQSFSAQVFATNFTDWYYAQLNGQNGLGKEHYWSNVTCKIHIISGENNTHDLEYFGQENVYLRFEDLRKVYGLIFNPNKESVLGKYESHGIMGVFIAGNINQFNQNFVGLFEHYLTLANDGIILDKWKIKSVHLRIKQTDVLHTPVPL